MRQRGRLVVIADGMGGQEGGQIASGSPSTRCATFFSTDRPMIPQPRSKPLTIRRISAIQNYAREHPELAGMGTTCTAAVLHGWPSDLWPCRRLASLSLARRRHRPLTRDQSYVQHMVEIGVISAGRSRTHPSKNILTSALGAAIQRSKPISPKPPFRARNRRRSCSSAPTVCTALSPMKKCWPSPPKIRRAKPA